MWWVRVWAVLVIASPLAANAQIQGDEPPVRAEARIDAIFARATLLHAGLGVGFRTGYNVRTHFVGAGGFAFKDGATEPSARADATLRLLLDPFGENPFGLSIGGGLTLLYDGFDDTRALGMIVVGLEGAPRAPIVWAVEVGLGGGARVGVVLRPRAQRYR
jgi:hypothetical protein